MTAWDRVNRLELDLAQAEARIKRLEGELRETLIVAGLEPFDGTTTHDRLRVTVHRLDAQRQNVEGLSARVNDLQRQVHDRTAERDRARDIAVALEQENAELVRMIDDVYGGEDVDDEALAARLADLDARRRRGDN